MGHGLIRNDEVNLFSAAQDIKRLLGVVCLDDRVAKILKHRNRVH